MPEYRRRVKKSLSFNPGNVFMGIHFSAFSAFSAGKNSEGIKCVW